MGIVIDALDEGRLRVNQAGFTDFLLDVNEVANDLSESRATYPVLFGRTGVIQDTWILLRDWFEESQIGVVEIECYDRETAAEFCFKFTKKIREEKRKKGELRYVAPGDGEKKIIELILDNLREKIDSERDIDQQRKFAGYAPVLTAVAYRVSEETNPSRFLGRHDVEESVSDISLAEINGDILEREHGKLKNKPGFVGPVASWRGRPGGSPRRTVARRGSGLGGDGAHPVLVAGEGVNVDPVLPRRWGRSVVALTQLMTSDIGGRHVLPIGGQRVQSLRSGGSEAAA